MSIESISQGGKIGDSGSTSALSSLSSDLDNFLMILTTQLTNQDPLSPMETNEFTNQLVSFANVEQNIAQSGLLEDLITAQRAGDAASAVEYMGKTVKVDHNELSHKSGETHELEYTMPEEAKNATIFIMDEAGDVVFTTPLEPEDGTNIYSWDAKDGQGNSLKDGNYHFEVSAVNEDSNEIKDIRYAYTGMVESVQYGEGKTTLRLGDISIDLGKVSAIVKPASAVN